MSNIYFFDIRKWLFASARRVKRLLVKFLSMPKNLRSVSRSQNIFFWRSQVTFSTRSQGQKDYCEIFCRFKNTYPRFQKVFFGARKWLFPHAHRVKKLLSKFLSMSKKFMEGFKISKHIFLDLTNDFLHLYFC